MARRIRVPVAPLVAGELSLPAEAARYVVRVLRLGPGDGFVAFDPELRLEADATLLGRDGRSVRCQLTGIRPAALVTESSLTLLQALVKGEKLDRVVRDATALGATRIVVVTTERCVPELGGRSPGRRERWRQIALESARQCGRGDVPRIEGPTALGAALAAGGLPGLRLCLMPPVSEGSTAPALGGALRAHTPEVGAAVLIGPEGGLTREEGAVAVAQGFTPVSFGPLTLRTETAAVAVLGALLAWRNTD